MQPMINRRQLLVSTGAAAVGLTAANLAASVAVPENKARKNGNRFRFCLNTSTIRGQKKTLE
ncbi:MAG: hypothetical protein IID45_09190, partial [Planctomycetes bacterium]|nr:hypothetical protein [Planctomycetota bacterium]